MLVYFLGAEDLDFVMTGTGSISTTATFYRSTYSRCSLESPGQTTWRSLVAFSATALWFSGQIYNQASTPVNLTALVGFSDSSDVARLRLEATGAANTFMIKKYDTAGTGTQLGSNFTMTLSAALHRLNIYFDNAVAGTVLVYWDAALVFSYSGDTTTEVTTLSYIRLGTVGTSTLNDKHNWSECIVCDTDTRTLSLLVRPPVANGNTHDFDTGTPAAANVNEVTLSDATLDGSSVAGQIDQYTLAAMPSGTFSILAVAISARMVRGVTGPTKMDLGVRSGATDYWEADHALTFAWENYQDYWYEDPNTAAEWAALPTNVGLRSVA